MNADDLLEIKERLEMSAAALALLMLLAWIVASAFNRKALRDRDVFDERHNAPSLSDEPESGPYRAVQADGVWWVVNTKKELRVRCYDRKYLDPENMARRTAKGLNNVFSELNRPAVIARRVPIKLARRKK
jgi:hypothetical protein